MKRILFALFILNIFFANWLIGNIGTSCYPCLIPVWPGIMAPSGVLAIGMGFTLRDILQRRLGATWVMAAIILGAALSAFLSPALALASGTAFLLSELADLVIYTPVQKKNFIAAVAISNIAGLVVDSVVFLSLAFGSLEFLPGQVLGKLWMTLLALPVIWLIREIEDRKLVF